MREGGPAVPERLRCANCTAAMDQGDRFCARCGAPNTAAGASLQVAQPSVEQDRRLVTVLFADLTGSTELVEQLDAEAMRGVLEGFFAALATEIRRFGGTIDKYAGDAVMAAFGAPIAHEDDVDRALRCALAMQQAIGSLNERAARDRGVQLSLRVGVNTGTVVAGPLTSEVQRAYTVVGASVNVAQRLQTKANGGEIVVGAATHRQSYQRFAFESLGPVEVKGFSEPVLAYRLIGLRETSAALESPGRAPLRAPLVGRDAELARVQETVAAVAADEGRILFITGEAGVGKSRLTAEARRAEASRPMLLREGRATTTGRTTSYAPFLEILRRDAGVADDESEAASWAKLERRFRELFDVDADDHLTTVASIAGFSGIAEVAERAKYLDAEALKQRTFTTARRLVQRLTRDLPLVLLFEDWHWADASSADLLERLLPLVETAPLLIVVIGREAPDTRMAGLRAIAQRDHAARTVEIQLRPLGPEDAQRLAALLLGVDALPPAVRSLVGNKTEGNPLYVEELVRALVELGGIEWEAESRSWRATERFHELVIPDTLQALIRARIDLLDEPVKQVLKIAAVLGRIFPDRVLRILAGAELPLDDALATLKAAGFIREQRRMPELEYVFKHALMHDAAYDSILLQRRKELHRSAGETIEGLYAGRQDEVAAILAYHFARAEDWERAQDYLFKAGDRASRIAADAEVLDHYREAMRAYARAFGDRWDPLQRAVLERKIGEALYRRSEYLEGREHIERSLSLLGKPFPRARVGVRLGIMAHAMRQIGHRRIPWLFPPRPDPRAEPIFRAGEAMAWIDWFVDPERLVLTALRVLNYSEEMANEPGTAYGCMAFGLVCGALGLHSVAGGYHARGVATAERLGHPGAQALCYLGLGWHQHHGLGDGQSAEANYLRAAELYKTAGDTRRWASPMSLRALLFIYRGELARARALSDSMLREAEDAADDTVLMYVLREHGATLCAMGDHTRGEPFLTRAIELGRRVPDYLTVVHAMGFLGDSLLARGELEDALAVLEEGEAMVRERRIRSPYATALRDAQVSAYLRLARTGDRMALRKAEGALKALRAQARLDCEALPPLERWRGTLLWIRGDEKKARAAWDRSLAAARSTGGRLDAALTLLESGRLTKERARIEEAAREFEAMGALGRLAEARALL